MYSEFKEFFPHNRVEYFVSYFDYYQPEAYIPQSDTYIEKDASINDEVISGCINMTGLLKIRTTKEFGESTVAKILDLVENASDKKGRIENFITRFARYYTPVVVFAALALAILPPLITQQPFSTWIYRALTFLVISCPCALVISIPLSFFGGIGGASACGILIKGSTYLEELANTGVVVFDKTGTLTQGTFKVTGIHPAEGVTDTALVEAAALAESWSKHPISLSIKAAYGKPIDAARVTDVQELGGHGVTAKVDGKSVAAGNARLMEKLGLTVPAVDGVGTIVHVAVEGSYAGYLLISDVVKPHSADAIRALKASGVRKTVMLTGDAQPVAQAVAQQLGLDEYHAGLLPAVRMELHCVVVPLKFTVPFGEHGAFRTAEAGADAFRLRDRECLCIRVVRPAREASISGKELRENELWRAALRRKRQHGNIGKVIGNVLPINGDDAVERLRDTVDAECLVSGGVIGLCLDDALLCD